MIDNINQFNQYPWLIIAFAPGSYGHKLGKWLINNEVVNKLNPTRSLEYAGNLLDNNHNYPTYFSDVLLPGGTIGTTEDYIQKELAGHIPNFDLINNILKNSKAIYNPNPNKYNLILTHYSRYRTLFELSNIFKSKTIRIVFDTPEQAQNAMERKRKLDNQDFDLDKECGDLCDNYYPFLHKFNFTIDIPVNNVVNLDLEFLKVLL